MMIQLTADELRSMSLFESLTGAIAKDCVLLGDKVVFIVSKGTLGKAIGKGGANINRVRTAFKNKRVVVVEDAETVEEFIKNLFPNTEILDINIHERSDGKMAYVTVRSEDRGLVIGRDGDKIKTNRQVLVRRFGCEMKIMSRG